MKIFFYSLLLSLLVSNAKAQFYVSATATSGTGTIGSPYSFAQFVSNQSGGKTFLFKRGDVFYKRIPKCTSTSPTNRLYLGAYGTGANPLFSGFTTINPSAWVLYSTNIWKAVITNSANVTGVVPTECNVGMIKADFARYGARRSSISTLVSQWQFYCDYASTLYVYSTSKPSLLASVIKVSNGKSDRVITLGNYVNFEHINVEGDASQGINMIQPLYDTIRYCRVRETGGEMKSLTDTLRQGAAIQLYGGATGCYVGYDTCELDYEDALTPQTHATTSPAIAFTDCIFEHVLTDSCENGFNGSVSISGEPGFIRDTVRNCRFNNSGYTWAHPPLGKPVNNMSVGIMSDFWLQTPTDNQLVFIHDTIYHPNDGVYFVNIPDILIPYKSTNNEIYMDSLTHIRRNCAKCSEKWTWRYKDHAAFVAASGVESGTNWHCLDCAVSGTSTTYYRDADGDGFGDPGTTTTGTVQPSGYVNNNTDCNDADATINPQTKWYLDLDGDGYYTNVVASCTSPGTGYYQTRTGGGDCNDADASIHPGAVELCDGIDNNCDGFIDNGVQSTFYRDLDGDGYGDANNTVLACAAPSGYVSDNTDCNDNNSAVNPGATEICGNGIDDNCNGQIDEGCGTNPTILIADTTVAESAGQVLVRIYLSATSTLTTNVDYYTIDGTATFPRDFKQAKGTATIAAGSLSTWITIKVSADKILEPTEVFSVLLQNPVNATISDNKADISITNSP